VLVPLGYALVERSAATQLAEAVAQSEDEAARQVRLFGAGLPETAPLLRAESAAVKEARELRWWNANPPPTSPDIGAR
jgi:hypothetical protein